MWMGTIKEPVVFDVPGGEDEGAPERKATPTVQGGPARGAQGVNPVTAVLMGAAMFVLGVFGLRKLLD